MTNPTLELILEDDTLDKLDDAGVADQVEDAAVDVTGGPVTAFPEDDPVVNVTQGEGYGEISDAVVNANEDDTIVVEDGTYESVEINVEGLTLEGPNAGIDGNNADARGSEATIAEGVDIKASDVTIDGIEIQNPGEQGTANPADFAGAVGVNIQTSETNVTVVNSVITEVGTNDDDANPIGVYSPDGTSGLTVSNNLITNLNGTDEDDGAVQAVLVDEAGTQITNVSVDNNTITDLTDTRSTVAVRFNGDVSGVISDNDISSLNTEGNPDDVSSGGGFTQVVALQKGGASETGPSHVTIEGNKISNIETTTEENFAPPFQVIIGENADGKTISVTDNEFNADSPDTDVYLSDGTGDLNLDAVKGTNEFDPDAVRVKGDNLLVPETYD